MSSEEQVFEYVFIENGRLPTIENNLLASPVNMSTGEANFVNGFLELSNSNQRYIIIQEDK